MDRERGDGTNHRQKQLIKQRRRGNWGSDSEKGPRGGQKGIRFGTVCFESSETNDEGIIEL